MKKNPIASHYAARPGGLGIALDHHEWIAMPYPFLVDLVSTLPLSVFPRISTIFLD